MVPLKWSKCYLWLMFSGSPWVVGAWFVYSALHKRGIDVRLTFGSQHTRSSTFNFHFQPRDARRCGESSWSWLRGEGTWVAFLFSVMNIYKPFEVKRHTPRANFETIPQLTRASRFQAPMVHVLLPAFLLRPLHWEHVAGSKTDTSTKSWTWDCSLEVTQFGWYTFLGR